MAELEATTPVHRQRIDAVLSVKMALVGLLIAIDAQWIWATDFVFEPGSAVKVVVVVSGLTFISWLYAVRRPVERFQVLCAETAVLLAFSAAAAVLSVLVISSNMPLIDDRLITFDAALGFDWRAYVEFVNARPWLGQLSSMVYVTSLSQVALTILALSLLGRTRRVQHFVTAVMVGALVSILVSALLPAAGALGTIRPPADFMALNRPIIDLAYKQAFFDIRDGASRLISLDQPQGLIAFPSYHCTLSVLTMMAFRKVRIWFWPVLVLNLAVILSTPIDGGHHLADALAGILVAFFAWKMAEALSAAVEGRRSHRLLASRV
ncbi:PAP2 superfamily protein [Aminobacter aminovorans]|uniref:Inositolphosphotransferase Aur1/Ipt1 domain-containing protein n=1 Tax=Aminobacter aminovorans TaxID=83263 RepID=A0A380WLS7_AMIAI|nr:phosphatase PAP2 family protein [Aminobacter aminovorans]TCS27850.1 PAP2 superfamily protein [Aminobacter aminovorans]SUU89738.1 Uncharacterised protein [Aminobacter aminovorans]